GIVKPAVGPVAVGAKNSGPLAIRGLTPPARRFGPVEIARDIMSWIACEEDFFDGVVIAVDRAVDNRLQRSLFGHGPKAGSHQHLFAQLLAACLPTRS